MTSGLPFSFLLGALVAALLLDAVLGGRNILGRLACPDVYFLRFAGFLRERLNRDGRSDAVLIGRAVLVHIVGIGCAATLGFALDHFTPHDSPGMALAALLLALIIGQHSVLDTAQDVIRALEADLGGKEEERYAAARWAVERLAFRFGDGLIANSLFFLLGGFTLLLPFRFISMLSASAVPSGLMRPISAFDAASQAVFQAAALIPSAFGRLIISLALMIIPKARPGQALTGSSSAEMVAATMASRRWHLMPILYGFTFATAIDPQAHTPKWIGPEDGKARLGPVDIRRVAAAYGVAYLICLLVLAGLLMGYMI